MSNPWTPGPWVVPIGGTEIIITTAEHDQHIATVNGLGDEAEANARLIAAAPEMADTIFKLADWLEGLGIDARHADRFSDETFALVAEARALLARIRGDAP